MTPSRARTGATLVELLVVMAIITALAALALMLLPSITNKDMTLKGTAEVQSTLKIAQGMAASSRLPRGVRLLVQQAGGTLSYEIQYLEAPPVMVADPQVLVAGRSATNPNGDNGPRVEISYNVGASGAITSRQCTIRGLTLDQASQVTDGATLVLPTLGAWSRIKSSTLAASTSIPGAFDASVDLEVFPDALMGAGTALRTYHFGVYGPPVPILGEPTVQLPQGIAVDLQLCLPQGTGTHYDILFAPSGQTIQTPSNPFLSPNMAVFLWVRDTRFTNMTPVSMPTLLTPSAPWQFDTTLRQFEKGGEQQIIGIRNGFIGTAPVLWPDGGGGTYSNGNNPYSLARQQLN
jgi:hypothetical protein